MLPTPHFWIVVYEVWVKNHVWSGSQFYPSGINLNVNVDKRLKNKRDKYCTSVE